MTGRPGLTRPWLNQLLAAFGPEEIAGPNHQNGSACRGGDLQPTLHLHPDGALGRNGVLGGGFLQIRKSVGAVVIDRTGQQDTGTHIPRRRDRAVQHRQHQLAPVTIAGRVDRVDDQGRATGGGDDIVGPHGVTLGPSKVRVVRRHPCGVAVQRPHSPATGFQQPRHLSADAAGSAEDEGGLIRFHEKPSAAWSMDVTIADAEAERNCLTAWSLYT